MNIPGEAEKRYGKPEDAESDVQVALSLGFKAGAEWARKEALRELIERAGKESNWGYLEGTETWLKEIFEEDN